MANQYSRENKICVRMNDADMEILDKLCSIYGRKRSEVIRGTIIARYKALVKKGVIEGGEQL